MIKNSTLKIKNVQETNYSNYSDSINPNYWGRNILLDSLQISKLKLKIEQLLNTNDSINNTDVIYTGQFSDIPRFKLKEFMSENKVKRTSRVEQSNCVLLSKRLLQELVGANDNVFSNKRKVYFFNKELVDIIYKEWDNSKNNYNTRNTPDKPKTDIDSWMYLTEDYVKGPNFSSILKSKKYSKYVSTHLHQEEVVTIYTRNKKTIEFLHLINFLYENPNIKVVFDENQFSELNKEGINLDSDIENTLKDMIYSKDKSNIKLGLEMISNLEVNDYTLYKVSLLLNNFINMGNDRLNRHNRSQITQLANTNRNLKTLLNTFKSKDIHWDRDWKAFASGLIKNFKNTEHEVLIKEYFIDKLNNEFKSLSGVKIKDIKFA